MASESSSTPAALGDKVAAAVARCCESPLPPGHGKRIAAAFSRESEADLRAAFAEGLVCFGGLTGDGQLVLAPADDELADASELLRAIDDAARDRRVTARRAAILAALPGPDAPLPDPPPSWKGVPVLPRHRARRRSGARPHRGRDD